MNYLLFEIGRWTILLGSLWNAIAMLSYVDACRESYGLSSLFELDLIWWGVSYVAVGGAAFVLTEGARRKLSTPFSIRRCLWRHYRAGDFEGLPHDLVRQAIPFCMAVLIVITSAFGSLVANLAMPPIDHRIALALQTLGSITIGCLLVLPQRMKSRRNAI